MRDLTSVWLLLVCLLVMSCGNDVKSGGFATALREQTDMPAVVARCVGELAESELSADAQAFLLAGMREDQAAVQALRARMEISEMTQAGMFMISAASRCGADLEQGTD